MANLIKDFTEVQKYRINLLLVIDGFSKNMNSLYELCLA